MEVDEATLFSDSTLDNDNRGTFDFGANEVECAVLKEEPKPNYQQLKIDNCLERCIFCKSAAPVRAHDAIGDLIGICIGCPEDPFSTRDVLEKACLGQACVLCGSATELATLSCSEHGLCRKCWQVVWPQGLSSSQGLSNRTCLKCNPTKVPAHLRLKLPCKVSREYDLDGVREQMRISYRQIPTFEYETLNDYPRKSNGEACLTRYQMNEVNTILQSIQQGIGHITALEMGMGKTRVAITVALELLKHDKTFPILVMCPLGTKLQWMMELEYMSKGRAEFANLAGNLSVEESNLQAITLMSEHYPGQKRVPFQFVIPETLERDSSRLSKTPWGMVIIDEGQRFKNPSAGWYAAVMNLCTGIKLMLTGMPIQNVAKDLVAVLELVNPTGLTFKCKAQIHKELESIEAAVARGTKASTTFLQKILPIYCTRMVKYDLLPHQMRRADTITLSFSVTPYQQRWFDENPKANSVAKSKISLHGGVAIGEDPLDGPPEECEQDNIR